MAGFPNVPALPGVPPLNRGPGVSFGTGLVLLAADAAIEFLLATLAPRWGVFLNGQPVLATDATLTFDFKQDYTVSSYPVEGGAFESYDKVQVPYDVRLRVASGSSEEARAALIDSIDAIIGSLDLYDVITPEKIYTSVNLVHVDYRRSSSGGVGMIVADLWFLQVRVTAQAKFSSTKSPGAAAATNAGTVQPISTTDAGSGVSSSAAAITTRVQ